MVGEPVEEGVEGGEGFEAGDAGADAGADAICALGWCMRMRRDRDEERRILRKLVSLHALGAGR